MPGVADCVADCVWLAVPEATERQRIGNQIDAAFIFARADFVNVHAEKAVNVGDDFAVFQRMRHL